VEIKKTKKKLKKPKINKKRPPTRGKP